MTPPIELIGCDRDAWQASLSQHVLPVHCSVAEAQTFRCSAVIARLRGNTVADFRVDASRIVGPAGAAKGVDSELVKVVWQIAGRSRIRQGPTRATLDAGMWTICDAAREFVFDFDRGARCLLILVPRAQCPGWLGALSELAAVALPAGGPAHIAMAILATTLRDVTHLDGESERTLHDSVVALVDHALSLELKKRGMSTQPKRSLRLSRVQSYMLERVADPALSVDRVAAVFGMSRRTLYNVFAPLGTTPHAFIQNAKLDRACALLNHPASRDAPMARIARQCGFTDPAHFSRAFHTRHGTPPTVWRAKSA